jgi:hypothetical protein
MDDVPSIELFKLWDNDSTPKQPKILHQSRQGNTLWFRVNKCTDRGFVSEVAMI